MIMSLDLGFGRLSRFLKALRFITCMRRSQVQQNHTMGVIAFTQEAGGSGQGE